MNERIKQLWEQAVHGDGPHASVIADFAELIVQECAKVMFETPVDYTEIDAMHRVRDRVKNHFGVE